MKRMTGFGWGKDWFRLVLRGERLVSAGFRWFHVGRTGFGWFRLVPLFSNYPVSTQYAQFYKIREEGGLGCPSSAIHLRTDDRTLDIINHFEGILWRFQFNLNF